LNKVDTSVFQGSQKKRMLLLELPDGGGHLGRISSLVKESGAMIIELEVENLASGSDDEPKLTVSMQMTLKSKRDVYDNLVMQLMEDPAVLKLKASESSAAAGGKAISL